MSGTPLRKLTPVEWTNVRVEDGFWSPRRETNRAATLPREYEMLKKSGTPLAYQWDWWDPAKGEAPWRIWVGDIGKWVEACAYSLATHPDPALEALVEDVVAGVIRGQKEDGYLYSNPIRRDQRWANLQEYHELYDGGHTIEGAVAHARVTGRRHFLEAMCRYADLLDATFGPEEGKKKGYDGHPEIELALVKLYRATGRERYLRLAKFFVDERGRAPNYFAQEYTELKKSGLRCMNWFASGDYVGAQAHKPLREQEEAVGHSVRAMYLYAGAADVAAETGDAELLATCRRLWRSAVRCRMYVIGAVGSTATGEAFTFDYDLPNETAYAETCANIALVFFAHRMLQLEADAEYADVMERALYNGVLSGVSLDGLKFFYANHLTVHPKAALPGYGRDHVASTRQEWFGCACCPPNVARLIASLGGYVSSTAPGAVYVHLYLGGRVQAQVGGTAVTLTQETGYPWAEAVRIAVDPAAPARFDVALRIPGWCRGAKLRVNGKAVAVAKVTKKGYAHVRRLWAAGDRIELVLPMPVERVEANPAVRMNCGKVALQRGPVVYCLEEVDNGRDLADLHLPRTAALKAEFRPRLLGGVVAIRGRGVRRDPAGWKDRLYRAERSRTRAADLLAVPYCVWGNRKPGGMVVWIRGD